MRTKQQQLANLQKLATEIGKFECNVVIVSRPGDVAFLQAVDTPGATEIVYAADGYDAWLDGHLQKTDLSLKQAAEIVVNEYFLAKTARILTRDPTQNADEIMKRLFAGYQR